MTATLTIEDRGHVRLIGLNRPEKRNAFTFAMLGELARAYTDLDEDPNIRCAVVFAHGPMFTAGLDLADVAPQLMAGASITAGARVDPWGLYGERCSKPVVMAVHGKCLTLGVELALASEIVVADETATFAQLEVARGIFPFGGATIRMAQAGGYQNAMRWLLTGDEFGVGDAQRLGLVQEVTPAGGALDKAIELAERIAAQAPLGVMATLRSTRAAQQDPEAAGAAIYGDVRALMVSEDAQAAVEAFAARTQAVFKGR